MELDLALKMLNRKGKERMMIKVHKHKGHKNHGPARVSLRMRTYYQLVNFAYKVRTQLPGVEDMFAKALKDKKDLYSINNCLNLVTLALSYHKQDTSSEDFTFFHLL